MSRSPLHKDLAKQDAEAIALALTWLEENDSFDHNRDRQLLMSFSTEFTSTVNNRINAEKAAKVGREMQKKLDVQIHSDLNHESEL